MNFKETMATDPPRMVVLFRYGGDGAEQYQWGVVKFIPVLSLIGAIIRVQNELVNGEWLPQSTEGEPALVITWDEATKEFSHFLHAEIPTDSLVGMLETIKSMLVDSRIAQHTAAQRIQPRILGPNGQPIR